MFFVAFCCASSALLDSRRKGIFDKKERKRNMNREEQLLQLSNCDQWDFIVIGGGASGLGAAVDAASRGFKTVLFEGVDFVLKC